jgi:hypothetical protein
VSITVNQDSSFHFVINGTNLLQNSTQVILVQNGSQVASITTFTSSSSTQLVFNTSAVTSDIQVTITVINGGGTSNGLQQNVPAQP